VQRIPDPASPPLTVLWETEWKDALLKAATDRVKRRMDPAKYQLFDCYVNRGWPPEKVAQAFGVTVGQVYLSKNRIVEKIKQEVRRLEREIT
jgi:hypothetical protein